MPGPWSTNFANTFYWNLVSGPKLVFWTCFWDFFVQSFRHFYYSKEWNYAIEVILNVLFLVGRAHRGKKNALFVQKFMVWWALSRINRAPCFCTCFEHNLDTFLDMLLGHFFGYFLGQFSDIFTLQKNETTQLK